MFTKHPPQQRLSVKGLTMGTPPTGRCGIRRSQRNRFWVAAPSSGGFLFKVFVLWKLWRYELSFGEVRLV